jgi:hypothetical protein
MACADDLYDLPPGIGADAAETTAARARCWPEVDSIETDGARRGERFICLAWARGLCTRSARCGSRHQLPTLSDEQRLLNTNEGRTTDIFGRQRGQVDERTMQDPLACQTLCVRGLPPGMSQHERRQALDGLSEWGAIAKTWVIADPTVGYVKFKWRSSAQVVAEAMQGQPISPDLPGALELSWCYVDPARIQAGQAKEMALAAMEEARARREASAALYERLERQHGALPANGAKRQRVGGNDAREAGEPELTDEASAWVEQAESCVSAVAAHYPGGSEPEAAFELPACATADDAPADAAQQQTVAYCPEGWHAAVDPASGFTYYYDPSSGHSLWAQPSTSAHTDSGGSTLR